MFYTRFKLCVFTVRVHTRTHIITMHAGDIPWVFTNSVCLRLIRSEFDCSDDKFWYSIRTFFLHASYVYPISLALEGEESKRLRESEREWLRVFCANESKLAWSELRWTYEYAVFLLSHTLYQDIAGIFVRIVYSSTNDLQIPLNWQKLVGHQHTKVRIIWWNLNYILWMQKLLLLLLDEFIFILILHYLE